MQFACSQPFLLQLQYLWYYKNSASFSGLINNLSKSLTNSGVARRDTRRG